MKSLTSITFLAVLIFLVVRSLSAAAEDATAAFDAANKLYAQGKFTEAASAYADLEGRRTQGKLLLLP